MIKFINFLLLAASMMIKSHPSHEHHPAAILELRNVRKIFGKRSVLDGFSLDIREGEILGIVGPSGCGKSTLFKILLGYYTPTTGEVLYKGKDIRRNLHLLRRAIGYTTQDDSFYSKLTVWENMRYYAGLYSVKKPRGELKEFIDALLEQVELSSAKDRLVENISGGMRRRLNFAISLLHDPDILVLDEPTTGLDPSLVRQFWKVVRRVASTGKTVIITSHIFPEVEEHCDRVAFMKKGKIQKTVDVKELLKSKRGVFDIFEEVLAS